MAIIPLLFAFLLFANKNNSNSILDLLKKIDLNNLLEILKEFNIGGDYLNFITPEFLNSILNGEVDIKSLLPLAIRFFANKKGENNSHPKCEPLKMDFMDADIKSCLFNYLKA